MAMNASAEDIYASSNMKTSESVVLKVQINCNCCARKVKKAIGQVEGVESIAVDLSQKKVTITGCFDSTKIAKQVAKKTGKSVELAGSKENKDKAAGKMKSSSAQQQKQKQQQNPQNQQQDSQGETFPVADTFFFSDDNPNGCSIM